MPWKNLEAKKEYNRRYREENRELIRLRSRLAPKRPRDMHVIPSRERAAIVQAYGLGLRLHDLAKRFHHDVNSIGHLIRSTVGLRKRHLPGREITKKWDYEFFSRYEDPIAAYWAGFLMADGCFTKRKSLTLSIHQMDEQHLHSFCAALGLDLKHVIVSREKMRGICLNHPNLKKHLPRWGIIRRKTYNFVAPDVPLVSLPHYLRGWIDGDGSIEVKPQRERLRVAGHPEAMPWFAEALRRCGYAGNLSFAPPSEGFLLNLVISGRLQVAEAYRILCPPGCIRLDRKWSRAEQSASTIRRCKHCGVLLKGSHPDYCNLHRTEYSRGVRKFCIKCGRPLGPLNKRGYCVKHQSYCPVVRAKIRACYYRRRDRLRAEAGNNSLSEFASQHEFNGIADADHS